MWFKNLHLYRLHAAVELSAEQLAEQMDCYSAKPLGNADARRIGWTAPAGRMGSGQLLHTVQNDNHRLLSALRQERLLPSSVVAEEVAEQIAAIEAEESRKVTRKEKTALKEQVTEDLLPRAFVRSQRIDVWWDTERQLIGVNASSRARAEEVLDLLRETLGSLKVMPLGTNTLPIRAMTEWVRDTGKRPADLLLGDSVVLKTKGDDGVLRGRQVDLDSDDMQQLLASGRQATQLAAHIDGQLSFVLHDDFALKQLRFGDALIEEADFADDGDDPLARLETDFVLMAGCLRASTERLLEWLGGEVKRQPATAA